MGVIFYYFNLLRPRLAWLSQVSQGNKARCHRVAIIEATAGVAVTGVTGVTGAKIVRTREGVCVIPDNTCTHVYY
jgi:hypothetical protein